MREESSSDDLLRGPEGADAELEYVAKRVGIAVGRRRYVTRHGLLAIGGGKVILGVPGDKPGDGTIVTCRPIADVAILSKPWYSFGTGMLVRIGDTSYTLEPEAIDHGPAFAILRRIRVARESVAAFERALRQAQASLADQPTGPQAA
jgi:hypothetical protein